jgi:SPP1 gp7 family putative phage head morphogenesis protein
MTTAAQVGIALAAIAASYEADLSANNGEGGAAKAEIDRTSARADGYLLLLVPLAAAWAARLEKVQQARWVQAVLSATKVDLTGLLAPSDMAAILKASADWNAALIKDISGEAEKRISNIVFAGLQQGMTRYDVAKEIVKATGMSRRRARAIAVDQTNKLSANLNKARQQQAGLNQYLWRHSAKLHARPTHLARNGQVFPWEGKGSVPPDDQPGVPPFCGCTAQPVIVFDDARASA